MHIKKNDTVVIIAGKDKGKKGKVLACYPKKNRVLVEGVNMMTKHVKPSAQMQQGGLVHQEGPIHASNVMVWSEKDKQGVRVGTKVLENGDKVRISRKSGEILD
ncbi:MAG: 50S ribosomal protein L24 [Tissierellales bacterium]|jgi:large subunit ribosomal protein L24|nr:50S ribosomal protein L24 [Tissierellales bacterium]